MARTVVSKILHSIFSDDAIKIAAISEFAEDIRLSKERFLPRGITMSDYRRLMEDESEAVPESYTRENMEKFRRKVDEKLKKEAWRKYEGLSEIDELATRRFYYYNSY